MAVTDDGSPGKKRKNARGPYRILVVNDYSPEETHGIAVHMREMVTRLRERGHVVVHFTTRNTTDEKDTYVMPAITNMYNKSNRASLFPGCRFYKTIISQKWDVIHLVYPTAIAWFVLPVAALRGIPAYCSHHIDYGFLNELYNKKGGCFHTFAYKSFGCVTGSLLYCPTGLLGTTQAGPTYTAMNKERPTWCRGYLDRVPTSIDSTKFCTAPPEQRERERRDLCEKYGISVDDVIIIQVGRLAPEKGQDKVLAVLDALVNDQDNRNEELQSGWTFWPWEKGGTRKWRLILVGDGPCEDDLKKVVGNEGLPVTFLGRVDNHLLPPMYRASDCFITCTASESFGITVLEAIACCCPVVIPRLDVFEELYGEHLADCMYIPYDINSMASAVREAVKGNTREKLAQAGTWDGVFLSWEAAVTDQERQYAAMITEYRQAKCCGTVGPRSRPRLLAPYTARLPDKGRAKYLTSFDVDMMGDKTLANSKERKRDSFRNSFGEGEGT